MLECSRSPRRSLWQKLCTISSLLAHYRLHILIGSPGWFACFPETTHLFKDGAVDWGFTQFMPLVDISTGNYIYPDGSLKITVEISIQRDEAFAYDSRKETGYVGLKNQGATCYMNSLLQYLYNIPYFRKVRGKGGRGARVAEGGGGRTSFADRCSSPAAAEAYFRKVPYFGEVRDSNRSSPAVAAASSECITYPTSEGQRQGWKGDRVAEGGGGRTSFADRCSSPARAKAYF
jgi:hypothetical protein